MDKQTISFHQASIQYLPEEDRILIKLNARDNQRFAMLLTRRFVISFWPALMQVLSSDPNFSMYDKATQKAAMEFQHEQVMSKADLKQPFNEDNLTYPMGQTPLLLVKATIKTGENGLKLLGLYSANNLGFEFAGNHHVLHYLYKGITQTIAKNGWNINLNTLLNEPSTTMDKGKLN